MTKDIDGHQFEVECAKLLRKQGFTRVSITKASCDQGIDILAYKDGIKYGIQCKYYSSPVGNKAVQEAYAGARYYNCDVAVVMTNATFTKSANELAEKIDVLLWPTLNTSPSIDIPLLYKDTSKIQNKYSIGIWIFVFIVALLSTKRLYHILGIFPLALVILFFLCHMWVKRDNNSKNRITEDKNKDTMDSAIKHTEKSNKDILLYAAMCEKHAQENDYMEKLGIPIDDEE